MIPLAWRRGHGNTYTVLFLDNPVGELSLTPQGWEIALIGVAPRYAPTLRQARTEVRRLMNPRPMP